MCVCPSGCICGATSLFTDVWLHSWKVLYSKRSFNGQLLYQPLVQYHLHISCFYKLTTRRFIKSKS